jgi:hypothetical protein
MKNLFPKRNIFLIFFSIIAITGLLTVSLNVQADNHILREDIKRTIILWGHPAVSGQEIINGIEEYIRIGVIEVANADDLFEEERIRISELEQQVAALEEEMNSLRQAQQDAVITEEAGPDILSILAPALDNYLYSRSLISFGSDHINPIFDGKVYTKQIQETSVSIYHRQSCNDGDYVLGGGAYVSDGNFLRESRPADEYTWFIAGSNIDGEPVPLYNFTILCLDVKTEGFSGEMAP